MMLHKTLEVTWQEMTLAEQLGNIGSEISRASRWQGKDEERFEGAIARALELFNFTLADKRLKHRLKEIARAREITADAALGGEEYGTTLAELLPYFDQFALHARMNK